MSTKGSFTRDELKPSSSFVQHHELLNVFLQPFFFYFESQNTMSKRAQEKKKKSLWWQHQGQHVWDQETWAQNNSFVGFGCFLQPGESRVVSELWFHNPAENSQERHRDANPFSRSGRPVRGVCGRSSTGRLVRGMENQLARTKWDYHNMQISDNPYIERAFRNVRKKLNHSEQRTDIHQKVNVLIWRLLVNNDDRSNASWTTL